MLTPPPPPPFTPSPTHPPHASPGSYGDPKLCSDKEDAAFAARFQTECSLTFLQAALAQFKLIAGDLALLVAALVVAFVPPGEPEPAAEGAPAPAS